MNQLQVPNFSLTKNAPLSNACRAQQLMDFHGAVQFIQQLPYGRNSRKDQLEVLITEQRGTCSTKHAFLAQLANEQGFEALELIMGIYQMNARNTGSIEPILNKHQLDYIPEAHNYLRLNGQRIDLTNLASMPESPFEVLMDETVIQPAQIVAFKPQYHRAFLQKWIQEEKIPYTLAQIWDIREACIAALQAS